MNLFVTGTDTGIGKTVVSLTLALKLGWNYWKPIQSGTHEETDSEWCARFLPPSRIHRESYLLTEPLSPHLSARLDGIEISTSTIQQDAQKVNETIIEGAGGLLVPLNPFELQIDLIQKLQVPAILVARSTLGTINHTLLSLEAFRTREIEPLGVILVGPENAANAHAIEHFGKTKILGEIPFYASLTGDAIEEAEQLIHLPPIARSRIPEMEN